MPYEAALRKGWEGLEKLDSRDRYSVSLLTDTYDVDVKDKKILSNSCNVPTKDYLTILILHYLIGTLKSGYSPSGEWVSFKKIESGDIYYPAFREAAIKPLIDKYGKDPKGILSVLTRFNAKEISEGDAAIEITAFPGINVRIIVWAGDEEFGPEATILFDRNLTKIYSMEDIVVFSRFVTHSL